MTLMKLSRIPLTRLMPRSEPISNFMNDSAMNPKKVVDALAAIAGKELFIASRIASCGSATFFR